MARRHRWLRVLILLTALVAVIAWFSHIYKKNSTATKANVPVPAIPVVVATATKGSLPIYLTGLGTVTALNTVTVRSRVDGELLSVPVEEGQIVHPGDLLAQIDPRPFQVQLEQAEGQMERDQALLANAKIDLE